jgi:hypothetical protein
MMKTALADCDTNPYLEKLERLIDPEHVRRTHVLQQRAFAFEPVEHIPTMIVYPTPPEEWPDYGFQEFFDDPGKMLLHELRDVYARGQIRR